MDFEYIYPVLILFGSFAVMLAIGVPITFVDWSFFAVIYYYCLTTRCRHFCDFAKDDCGAGWLYAISHSLLRVSRKHYEYRWYSQTTG